MAGRNMALPPAVCPCPHAPRDPAQPLRLSSSPMIISHGSSTSSWGGELQSRAATWRRAGQVRQQGEQDEASTRGSKGRGGCGRSRAGYGVQHAWEIVPKGK